MLILTIRSDKPDAELGLFNDNDQLGYEIWEAHRALAETIHTKIETLLVAHRQTLQSLGGVVVFRGPGSFTGLRIGLTVANALVASLQIPIAASGTDNWIKSGIERLLSGQNDQVAMPEYGALPNITAPRK